jgi:formylglycine-generating enzyme required for sulfatase activity
LIAIAFIALIVWGISSFPTLPKAIQTPSAASTLGIGSTMIGEDGATLVYVPAGEFTMGSNGYDDEKPVHTVYLDAFWIDKTEVTNKMYAKCVDAGVCTKPTNTNSRNHSSYYGNSEFDNYPVIYVNWNMAKTYCEWAGRRLPTEAQWEKAARGTDARIYPWGDDAPNDTLLNYNYKVGDTAKVGSYETGKSPYGAYDMAGNVWEWVNDWYQSDYYAVLGDSVSNPQGPSSGDRRVLRGGAWVDNSARSAIRYGDDPSLAAINVGFRCARSP